MSAHASHASTERGETNRRSCPWRLDAMEIVAPSRTRSLCPYREHSTIESYHIVEGITHMASFLSWNGNECEGVWLYIYKVKALRGD